jgi:hypothetical protein
VDRRDRRGERHQLALGRPVSTNSAWSANLAYATDGSLDTSKYVNLNGGVIYVQVDLGKDLPVNGVQLWHYYGDGRTYHDVIVRLSITVDFSSNVFTIFNNDSNNSAGLGATTSPAMACHTKIRAPPRSASWASIRAREDRVT